MKRLIYLCIATLAITTPTTAFASKDLLQLSAEEFELVYDVICEATTDLKEEEVLSELDDVADQDISYAKLEEISSAAVAAQKNMTSDQRVKLCNG